VVCWLLRAAQAFGTVKVRPTEVVTVWRAGDDFAGATAIGTQLIPTEGIERRPAKRVQELAASPSSLRTPASVCP